MIDIFLQALTYRCRWLNHYWFWRRKPRGWSLRRFRRRSRRQGSIAGSPAHRWCPYHRYPDRSCRTFGAGPTDPRRYPRIWTSSRRLSSTNREQTRAMPQTIFIMCMCSDYSIKLCSAYRIVECIISISITRIQYVCTVCTVCMNVCMYTFDSESKCTHYMSKWKKKKDTYLP